MAFKSSLPDLTIFESPEEYTHSCTDKKPRHHPYGTQSSSVMNDTYDYTFYNNQYSLQLPYYCNMYQDPAYNFASYYYNSHPGSCSYVSSASSQSETSYVNTTPSSNIAASTTSFGNLPSTTYIPELIINNNALQDHVNINDHTLLLSKNHTEHRLKSKSSKHRKHQQKQPISIAKESNKEIQCKYCGNTFKSLATLCIHERIHTGYKPYRCKYCKNEYSDFSTKTKHERTHTRVRPYSCALCDKAFTQIGNLYRHMRNIHIKKQSTPTPQSST